MDWAPERASLRRQGGPGTLRWSGWVRGSGERCNRVVDVPVRLPVRECHQLVEGLSPLSFLVEEAEGWYEELLDEYGEDDDDLGQELEDLRASEAP